MHSKVALYLNNIIVRCILTSQSRPTTAVGPNVKIKDNYWGRLHTHIGAVSEFKKMGEGVNKTERSTI